MCAASGRRGVERACATGAGKRHLSHSSVATTAMYTEVDTKDLARVMEKAHPRERAWKKRPKASRK